MSDIKHIKSEIKFMKEQIKLIEANGHDASHEKELVKWWEKELKKEEGKLNN